MVSSGRTTTWPEDSTPVDVMHEDELVFWCTRFGVSPLALRQAVKIVGDRFRDVSRFLRTKRLPEGSDSA